MTHEESNMYVNRDSTGVELAFFETSESQLRLGAEFWDGFKRAASFNICKIIVEVDAKTALDVMIIRVVNSTYMSHQCLDL